MRRLTISTLLLFLFPLSVFADDIPERPDVDAALKWDLSSMYASWDAWESDFKTVKSRLPEIEAFRGKLDKNAKTLLAAFRKVDEIELILGDVFVFAGLSSFEDLRNSDNNARFSRARALNSTYSEATAFMRPELLAINPKKLKSLIKKTPDLAIYQHDIDRLLRLKPYTLSETEEKLLAAASDPLGKFNNVFTALDNADISFGEITNEDGESVELTKGRYGTFVYSPDRQVREDAWKGLFKEYERLGNTLAAIYEGHVKSRIFLARARGYDSALHAATYGSAIPMEVYTSLIEAARNGSGPLQRYLRLRQKQLDVETLEVWDLYAPIVEPTLSDVPWEEAKNIVADALKPLGEEYLEIYWKGFDEHWVDAIETKGKRGGAYSWGTYQSKPYLSMNYDGTINDVSTLAHEYGHSIHRYLYNQEQPLIYSGARTFIAEVASMTNEALLYQKLLKEVSSPQERIFLLQKYLDDFRGSFFRQVSFADFEMQAHASVEGGGALTKESLNKIYAGVFNAYYGDAVRADPLNDSEWSRIPHFLRPDNFYVYQYATSFAAATALAKKIRDEGEPARDRFLDLLRSGNNDYPIELLRKAGIDMASPQPIMDTIAEFDLLVNELEAALAR